MWEQIEKRSGLPHVARRGWHSFRRKLVQDLKHVPLAALAAIGGWKGPETILKCYMEADEHTMRRAVDEREKRRDAAENARIDRANRHRNG